MSEYTPDSLAQLLDQRRRLDAEIGALILHNVQSTAAATTVAGYETLSKRFESLALGIESLQALYIAQQAHLAALQRDVRALHEEVRALREPGP